ncbi:MAG TPA: biotin--[acetyl-CoA-carboxylase] ligase [Bacteroidales bacterium]|nr:biotin--[acetyl-CoA-carboxylase] ligase [Bacteroidales bacterium]
MSSSGKIYWYDELDSTNKEMIKQIENLASGDVIVTKQQSAGRGLGENHWHSKDDKNLTFSYFLVPDNVMASQQYIINMAVANAIRDFLAEKSRKEVVIKWPNDILVEGKKIAGVLIQHALMGEEILHSTIGIGLNVNQLSFPGFTPPATSLGLLTGEDYNLKELLKEISEALTLKFKALKQKEQLKAEFLSNLFRFKQWKKYVIRGKETVARIEGISETGFLQLIDAGHKHYECDLKEVVYIY